jgi:hypothetical protein
LHFGSEDLGQTLFQMSESQLAISSKVIEADLAPCLVSKLEINRGQWLRLGGSLDAPLPEQDGVPGGPVEDALYPVERVSHPDCVRTLERAALALPSGLQLRHAPLGGDSGIRHLPDIDWVWTSDPDRSNPGGLNGEHFRYYAMPASPTVERMFFATERRSGLGVRPVFPLREPPPVR